MSGDDEVNAHIQKAIATQSDASTGKGLLSSLLEPPKPTVFEAVSEGFHAMIESLFRIYDYAHATKSAFDHLTSKDPDELIDPEDLGNLIAAVSLRGDADFLRRESDRSDAMIYGQATISLWTAFVCGIEGMIAALLANDSKLLALDIVTKLQISFGTFSTMTEQQRVHSIAKSIIAETKGGRFGDHYSKALEKLGCPNTEGIDDRVKRVLIEFWAVRNCLVHNHGIVDDTFKSQWGDSPLAVGSAVSVTNRRLGAYVLVAAYWATKLCERIERRYPVDPAGKERTADFAKAFRDSLLRQLDDDDEAPR